MRHRIVVKERALVGELGASIMHEIRQPLTAMLANAAAGKVLAQDSEIRAIFEEIEHSGISMGEIIEHLRTLVAELAPALPSIQADRVCLQQVLLNLVVNALHAVSESAGSERRVIVRTRSAADWVEISVSDTGNGIPADVLPKLIAPNAARRSDCRCPPDRHDCGSLPDILIATAKM